MSEHRKPAPAYHRIQIGKKAISMKLWKPSILVQNDQAGTIVADASVTKRSKSLSIARGDFDTNRPVK